MHRPVVVSHFGLGSVHSSSFVQPVVEGVVGGGGGGVVFKGQLWEVSIKLYLIIYVGLQLINLDAFWNYIKLLICKLKIIISIFLEGFPNIIHFLGWIFSCILKKAISRINKRTSSETVQIFILRPTWLKNTRFNQTHNTHTHI